MIIENCDFADDLYFDVENDVWLKILDGGLARVGITTVLSFLAGKIDKIKFRQDRDTVRSNGNLATIESIRYFGAVRSPVSAKVKRFNESILSDPSVLNRSPYGEGWVAELQSMDESELAKLPKGESAKPTLEMRIKELHVRCFRLLPDEEMNSVGLECAATLANLNELLSKSRVGTVVHVISDDPFAEIEMIRWSDQTKNELVESRKEGNLFHFVVRKSQ